MNFCAFWVWLHIASQDMAFLITQPFNFNCQIVNKSLVQRCLKEPSFYICSTLRVRSIWLEFRNNLVQRYLIGCVFLTCESKVPTHCRRILHLISPDFCGFNQLNFQVGQFLNIPVIFLNVQIFTLYIGKTMKFKFRCVFEFLGARVLVVGAACYFIPWSNLDIGVWPSVFVTF